MSLYEEDSCDINRNCAVIRREWEEWETCQFNNEDNCGDGIRTRRSNCFLGSNITRSDICDGSDFEAKQCSEDCDRDCVVSDWSMWTKCDGGCGAKRTRSRYRKVIEQQLGQGSPCPDTAPQQKPCRYIPCVRWEAQNWFPCVPYYGSCGLGSQSRNFSCLSNDRLAQKDLCKTNLGSIDDQFPLNERERQCKIPCKGEYRILDWTQWSLCQVYCTLFTLYNKY